MIRDRLVYKTALSLVTIATSGAIRLIFSVLVGRVFGASTLGHVNVIVSTAVFATLLCSPGIGQSVARQLATRGLDAAHPEGRRLLAWATGWHHAICLSVAVVAAALVPAHGWGQHLLALALTFGYGGYTFYKAVLYGVDMVRRYAGLELAWDALFVLALAVVVLARLEPWVLAPMALVYLGFAASAHLALFGSRRRSRGSATVPAAAWRGIVAFAAVTTVGTASSAGFLQLSQIFAARADSSHGAGLFAAAMTLVTPAYLLPRAISVVLFPAMARAAGRSDRDTVRRQLTVGTDILAAALLPVFAFVAMVATAVLTGIYGPAFAGGAGTFAVMTWATWVSIASVPAVNALSADTGRAYLVPAGASVAGFLIGLAFWLTLGTSISMVAWGYLVGSVVQSAIPMVEARRRHGGPGGWLAVRITAVAAGGLAAAVLLTNLSTALQVCAGVIAVAVSCLVVLPELRSLVRLRGAAARVG